MLRMNNLCNRHYINTIPMVFYKKESLFNKDVDLQMF